MDTANLVLEYIKVLLSLPVVAAVAIFAFVRIFKEEIRSVLKGRPKIKLGAFEFSQVERSNEELPARGEKPSATPPEAPSLPDNLTLTPEQIKRVVDNVEAERARATLWGYRYLNYYLARSTQHVLDWLASLDTRTTLAMFDSVWLPVIPSTKERHAIINALESHYLIALRGEVIEITPKGHEYLEWRGPLPDEAT
jgi:hypothetical protein